MGFKRNIAKPLQIDRLVFPRLWPISVSCFPPTVEQVLKVQSLSINWSKEAAAVPQLRFAYSAKASPHKQLGEAVEAKPADRNSLKLQSLTTRAERKLVN